MKERKKPINKSSKNIQNLDVEMEKSTKTFRLINEIQDRKVTLIYCIINSEGNNKQQSLQKLYYNWNRE